MKTNIYIYIYTYTHTHFIVSPSALLRMRNVSVKRCGENHSLCLTLILLTWRKWWAPNNASKWQMGFNSAFKGLITFFPENCAVYEIGWKNIVELGTPQYGACALHAGYQRLQTHAQNMYYWLFFHCSNGYANAPQYYTVGTWHVLFTICLPPRAMMLLFLYKDTYLTIKWVKCVKFT